MTNIVHSAFSRSHNPSHVVRFGALNVVNKSIHRKDETLSGSVSCVNGSVKFENVTLKGMINTVNGAVKLTNGTTVQQDVTATNGSVQVEDSTVQGDMTITNGGVSLKNATAQQDVHITGDGKLETENATIGGTLTLTAKTLTLKGLTVKNIHLEQADGISDGVFNMGSGTVIGNITCGTFTNGSIIGGNIVGGGKCIISVQPGCSSSVNGYKASVTGGKTQVVTPDGTRYVNGDKVSGNGPNTYAAYQNQHPNAPEIKGPGWKAEGTLPPQESDPEDAIVEAFLLRRAQNPGVATAYTLDELAMLDRYQARQEARKNNPQTPPKNDPPKPKEPEQILELGQGAKVTGKITFESGNGKVIVHPGAVFTGTVEGGEIERQ